MAGSVAAAGGRSIADTRRRPWLAAAPRQLVAHALLAGFGGVMLVPLLWMLSTSLKLDGLEFEYPPRWIPSQLAFDNYAKGLTILPFGRYLVNTLVITIIATAGSVLSSSFVAFGFARLRFPERDKLFLLVLATLMIPWQVTLIPTFILFKELGWVNTYLPLTVTHFFGGGAFNIFLMRQYYMTIPYDLDEAARIDGASSLQIWWRVLLPLATPALGTIAVFGVLHNWNDFLGPLIYMNKPDMRTMALGLQFFIGQYGTRWNQLMAVSVIMTLPIIALFFSAQRLFMRGIVMTGMGGR